MSNTINLDAKRAARRAARGEHITLTVAGNDIRLRSELSMNAFELLENNDLRGFMQAIVVPDDWDRFAALDFTMDDVFDVLNVYMEQMGESAASIASSKNIGAMPRPTSNASTVSTSPSAAGVSAPLDQPA